MSREKGKAIPKKGKGKAPRAEREKGKLVDVWGSLPLGNGHRAHAQTKRTDFLVGGRPWQPSLPPIFDSKNMTVLGPMLGPISGPIVRQISEFVRLQRPLFWAALLSLCGALYFPQCLLRARQGLQDTSKHKQINSCTVEAARKGKTGQPTKGK